MIITLISVFLFGLAFLLYGIYLFSLNKLCDTAIEATYMPPSEPPRKFKFFVYEIDGKKIIASLQNITSLSELALFEQGKTYTVFINSRHPSILISSKKFSVWHYILASCSAFIGIFSIGLDLYIILFILF